MDMTQLPTQNLKLILNKSTKWGVLKKMGLIMIMKFLKTLK